MTYANYVLTYLENFKTFIGYASFQICCRSNLHIECKVHYVLKTAERNGTILTVLVNFDNLLDLLPLALVLMNECQSCYPLHVHLKLCN
eukprot:Awhi_evm1s1253